MAAECKESSSQRNATDAALSKYGFRRHVVTGVGHSLLLAIQEVLKCESETPLTYFDLLTKLEGEILAPANLDEYGRLLSTGRAEGATGRNLDQLQHAFEAFTITAAADRVSGSVAARQTDEMVIRAMCNAMNMTIIMVECSTLSFFPNFPTHEMDEKQTSYLVHILRSSDAAGQDHYDALVRVHLGDASDSSSETAAHDEEVEAEMKSLGILIDDESSITTIAEAVAKLPELDLIKRYRYVAYATRRLNAWRSIRVNVGVIGTTGTGKSSFINAFRGIDAEDPKHGAKVDSSGECTQVMEKYTLPTNPNILVWDLPGVNTKRFPQETYLIDIDIDKYDVFVIVSNDRFTETDAWLAKEISSRKKPFYFVRTKIGACVSNDKKAHKTTHDPAKLIAKIRERTEAELKEMGLTDPVYLVDNYKTDKYDFQKLQNDMILNLDDLQRQTMINSLDAFTEVMIKLKAAEQRKSNAWKSLLTMLGGAGVGAIAIGGIVMSRKCIVM